LDEPLSCFVICINNKSNPASLILGKVYRSLPDASAETHGMIRVIDEDKSEPDGYLYPASMFAPIELPEAAERALMAGAEAVRSPSVGRPCSRQHTWSHLNSLPANDR